ncbi:hypothetical protein PTSG_07847, partial [Salpingoeca rosetta]
MLMTARNQQQCWWLLFGGVCAVWFGLLCVQHQQRHQHHHNNSSNSGMAEFYVPTVFARLQSSFQAATRPALWFSPMAHLHSRRKEWVIEHVSMDEAKNRLLSAAVANAKEFQLAEPLMKGDTIQVLSYTKAEWLDVMEFELEQANEHVRIKSHSFSSGLVPVSVPGAPLLNMATFFVPFLDHGLNGKRLKAFMQHTTHGAAETQK